MDEQTAITRCRRKPFLAAFLSFISIGLGYVYCGRIVRGLVVAFIITFLLPFISSVLSFGFPLINMKVIVVLVFISSFIWLASIIDTFFIARKRRRDYELKEYNRWYVYFIFYIFVTISTRHVALNEKIYSIDRYEVSSTSMFPTKQYHDRFFVNINAYKKESPKRGDIIIFDSPKNREDILSKRVMAVAGDTVEMKDNQLFINGEKLIRKSMGKVIYPDFIKDSNEKDKAEGEIFIEKNGKAEYEIFMANIYGSHAFPDQGYKEMYDFPEIKVPEKYCFVMGDNRNLSKDSRIFGPIPLTSVTGRIEYLYWPAKNWSRFGQVK